MPPVRGSGLLRRNNGGISRASKSNTRPRTLEKAMILFTSSTQNIAAPVSGGWSLKAVIREMLNSWLAHHQRLADSGIGGDL
ncbi:hypothetical protein MCBMB27_01455 [Methylobacterium phyllosphaerae]|jgi:hypothetical protein|uniref:Uncharacterized protein n=2 Tax=Methylobacterium TaxID=407 RepID=A0AAE8HMX9_9HYPH|nr:hypothetical protein MCBMB27_01455 [Methylobacterium phyllosphaerae]SFG24797.1 hypothetical protein SAMN05192567_101241 [Methylobacterium phyllosphaerae]